MDAEQENRWQGATMHARSKLESFRIETLPARRCAMRMTSVAARHSSTSEQASSCVSARSATVATFASGADCTARRLGCACAVRTFEISHRSIHHDCMASALPALLVAHAQVPAMLMRLRSPGKTFDVGAHVPQTAGNYVKAPIPEFHQAPHLLQRGPRLGELALDGAELRMTDRRRRVAGILVQQQALARRAQRQRPLLREHAWEATTDIRMSHCQP